MCICSSVVILFRLNCGWLTETLMLFANWCIYSTIGPSCLITLHYNSCTLVKWISVRQVSSGDVICLTCRVKGAAGDSWYEKHTAVCQLNRSDQSKSAVNTLMMLKVLKERDCSVKKGIQLFPVKADCLWNCDLIRQKEKPGEHTLSNWNVGFEVLYMQKWDLTESRNAIFPCLIILYLI